MSGWFFFKSVRLNFLAKTSLALEILKRGSPNCSQEIGELWILCVEDPEFWSKCPRHFWSTLEYSNSLIKNITVQLYMQPPAIIWCFPHVDLLNISRPLFFHTSLPLNLMIILLVMSFLHSWLCLVNFYLTFKIWLQGHVLWRDFISFVRNKMLLSHFFFTSFITLITFPH